MNNKLLNLFLTLLIIITGIFIGMWLYNKPGPHEDMLLHETTEQEFPRGLHNGRLLESDQFALEITIFESGVPPEFHVYPYFQGQAVEPGEVDLEIALHRTGSVIDTFVFQPWEDYLRGDNVVTEPHSFDVVVTAAYQGKNYHWEYENHEGRTIIPATLADEAGIKTEIAGPAAIKESLALTGRVEIDPNRLSQVRARYPGVVRQIRADLGDTVKAGQRLLTIQSNESLQDYSVKAPISGQIIKRNVQIGETVAGENLFTLVDLSQVWVELDIFAKDAGKIQIGQSVTLETMDGFKTGGTIDWISPLSSHASQSIHARVPTDNPDKRLRPGQFVRATVDIAKHEVPLAVKQSAVQRFRDFQVVYARFGDTYEVRMLEFGISDDEWRQVTNGLSPGTEYVTENSYLIKADIEKSGASHDH